MVEYILLGELAIKVEADKYKELQGKKRLSFYRYTKLIDWAKGFFWEKQYINDKVTTVFVSFACPRNMPGSDM